MFNKQQINALWNKINAKYGESGGYKESSVEELKTMLSEGKLSPGTVYSYDITDANGDSITVYQEAITPTKLNTKGVITSDIEKYNNQEIDIDINKNYSLDVPDGIVAVLSDDNSELTVYEDGVEIEHYYVDKNLTLIYK